MRRLRYSVAASLDGFIAGPEGEFDWIPMDDAIDFGAFMSKFDTAIMGRRTYDLVRSQQEQSAVEGMRTYVFSRTLEPGENAGVTIVADDAARFVAGLKEEDGKDIWLFGGGVMFRSLHDAGLVDRVEVGIVPVLIGSGIPLLPPGDKRVRLRHVKNEAFPSGIILGKYDVLNE